MLCSLYRAIKQFSGSNKVTFPLTICCRRRASLAEKIAWKWILKWKEAFEKKHKITSSCNFILFRRFFDVLNQLIPWKAFWLNCMDEREGYTCRINIKKMKNPLLSYNHKSHWCGEEVICHCIKRLMNQKRLIFLAKTRQTFKSRRLPVFSWFEKGSYWVLMEPCALKNAWWN